jgi:sortase A
MLLRLIRKRRMMGQKLFILLLFFIGITMVVINAYWFIKGISAVESIPIEVNETAPPQELQPTTTIEQDKALENKPVTGEQYAHLLIPKLEARIPIFYGSKEEQLKHGIGHVERTALPGEDNNMVLSGHRDTVFRHLGKIEKGDQFIVETKAGTFTYRVRKIRIVDKDSRTVIIPKPRPTLTVITCYPFGFVGNAPKRFVVIADLVVEQKVEELI